MEHEHKGNSQKRETASFGEEQHDMASFSALPVPPPLSPLSSPASPASQAAVLSYLGLNKNILPAGTSHEQLVEAFQSTEWTQRVHAVQRLARQHEDAPVELLLTALVDIHEAVRAATAKALGELGERVPLEPLLNARHDTSWYVRSAVVNALGKNSGRVPADVLVDALRDEHEEVRAMAAWAVGRLGGQAPLLPLLEALRDSDWMVREAATNALKDLKAALPQAGFLALQNIEDGVPRNTVRQPLRQAQAQPPLTPPSFMIPEPLVPGEDAPTWSKSRPRSAANEKPLVPRRHSFPEPTSGTTRPLVTQRTLTRARTQQAMKPHSLVRWQRDVTHVMKWSLVALVMLGILLPWLLLSRAIHPSLGSNTSLVYTYRGHTGAVQQLAWSPSMPGNVSLVASAGVDGTVQVWDAINSDHIYTRVVGHVLSLEWVSDSVRAVVVRQNNALQVIGVNDVATTTLLTIAPSAHPVVRAALSPSGGALAVAYADGTIHLWNIDTRTSGIIYPGHVGTVTALAWSPDGSILASASDDGIATHDKIIEMWSATTGNQVVRTQYEAYPVTALAWSSDNRRLAYTTADGSVWMRDTSTDTSVLLNPPTANTVPTKVHFQPVLAWSSDEQHLATTTATGDIDIWDANTGALLSTLPGHTSSPHTPPAPLLIHDLVWSADGSYIASANDDGTVQVWKVGAL